MSAQPFRPIWIVPCYRHETSLRAFVPQLLATHLPVLVIDDGNEPPIQPIDGVHLIRSEQNSGKGAALALGAQWAAREGYTHIVQIDADGQHTVADAMAMIEAARADPETLYSGFPIYDASVPKSREKGRAVTRFFIWLETGLAREDGLCGCRVYPLATFLHVIERVRSRRMGFDVEVIVKWAWAKGAIKQFPVHVCYPLDGISNFRMLHDNLSFFALHSRLCLLRVLHCLRILR